MYPTSDVRSPVMHHTPRTDHVLRGQVKDLHKKVSRMQLLCQAMYEMLEASGQLNRKTLEARMQEIDRRDGIEDDAITDIPLRCPTCSRVSSSRNWRCLYCGLEFERPISG